MPTFAGIDGNDVVSLCYAPARINAEKAWTMKGVERIAEIPDREGGWTFSAARAHLFPAECTPPTSAPGSTLSLNPTTTSSRKADVQEPDRENQTSDQMGKLAHRIVEVGPSSRVLLRTIFTLARMVSLSRSLP